MSGTGIDGEGDIGRNVTVVEPFNLTKPRPKVIPQPEALLRETKANPVPKNLFKKTLADVEKEKEERRLAKIAAVRKEYEENPAKRFTLTTEQRPNAQKFEEKKKLIETERDKELKFSGQKSKPVPNFEKIEAPVKLTAAAVKREALALKKAEELEEKRLKDLEWNQRDETEFVTWKAEMDQKENIERLEHIQMKKIEMELSRE